MINFNSVKSAKGKARKSNEKARSERIKRESEKRAIASMMEHLRNNA